MTTLAEHLGPAGEALGLCVGKQLQAAIDRPQDAPPGNMLNAVTELVGNHGIKATIILILHMAPADATEDAIERDVSERIRFLLTVPPAGTAD